MKSIDARILPLVETLAAIEGVRTIASCQGHFGRISSPYVYFACPPLPVAEALAQRLDDLRRSGKLHHWWHITGSFNDENKLCFLLEAPALSDCNGDLSKFIHYVLLRSKIDQDFSTLKDAFQHVEGLRPLEPRP